MDRAMFSRSLSMTVVFRKHSGAGLQLYLQRIELDETGLQLRVQLDGLPIVIVL